MISVWIVTPAYRRYDLSKVCFAQHAWVAAQLRPRGVDVVSCVIADDDNLDLASSFGFASVERQNDYLGARFNDGYQYAAAEGADFICPLGSDSWIHPDFFAGLGDPKSSTLLTSTRYALVCERGERFAELSIPRAPGVGPHIFPTRLIGAEDWRPVRETIQRGCDHSLISAIQRHHSLALTWLDIDPAQYVGFRTAGEQLNPYEQLANAYAKNETSDPWAELERLYPDHLVEEARSVYAARNAAA